MDGDTPTIMDTTRNGCNGTASTAGETGLVFPEMLITKMVINSVAANISNGADIAVITKENNDLMLVTDKFDPMAITDKNDPLLVTDKNIFGVEVHKIPTALEVYNIPRDTLEVAIPTTLEIHNIPGNTLEVCSIPTTDNAVEVYGNPGNMLEVYNIPNTRDNFAGNFGSALVVSTG